ncbi:MAG: hypothetical protein JWO38_6245 [Gemmataceae bacterium]|nr:hypothetical protein [Gemmataceae bacterium]
MTGCLHLLAALTLTGPVPAAPVPPGPSPPLSPASLPAPVPPTPAAPPAGVNISWNLEFGHISGTPDECRLKAVAAIAAQDRFRFAEIGPDGAVWGYTDTCRIKVIAVVTPPHDGAVMYVMVVSREPGAERVGLAVHDHLMKAPRDPKTPERAGTRAPDVEKNLLHIAWHLEARAVNRLSRHFGSAAELVLDKRGYTARPTPASPTISGAFGGREGHFTLAVATPGVPGISTNVLVASVGVDGEAAAREAKTVCTAILKILFD